MDFFYENIGYTRNSRCAMKEHKVTEITLLRTHLLNSTTSGKMTQFIKPRASANSDKAGFGRLPIQCFFVFFFTKICWVDICANQCLVYGTCQPKYASN